MIAQSDQPETAPANAPALQIKSEGTDARTDT
jgi:hypothetical protein